MTAKRIEKWEVQRYWEIFSTEAAGGQYLNSDQAARVLRNSKISEDQLAKIWDLADLDDDGRLDFEEFCVAMRLAFDVVNGDMKAIPNVLPDWLVPSSKAHFAQARRAISGLQPELQRPDDIDSDSDTPGLKNNFDWYMPPKDRGKYEEIYNANSDHHGEITFESLEPLYSSLDVPDTDIRSAWNLVNPKSQPAIGKDACLAYLHVLNGRHEGYRLPRNVPPSLRATFERNQIDYQIGRNEEAVRRWDSPVQDDTRSTRKAKFGEAYLTRMGLGGGTNYTSAGTDFSTTTPDWEEVRLKKELQSLEEKIEDVEKRAEDKRKRRQGGKRDTKPALVKRELQQLLEYKKREIRELEMGEGKAQEGMNMKSLREEVDSVREQVEGLDKHWKERQAALDELRAEVDIEKL